MQLKGRMEYSCEVAANIYDGQVFERRELIVKETGLVRCRHTIDGVEVSKEEWQRRQEIAIARDMAQLGIRPKSA